MTQMAGLDISDARFDVACGWVVQVVSQKFADVLELFDKGFCPRPKDRVIRQEVVILFERCATATCIGDDGNIVAITTGVNVAHRQFLGKGVFAAVQLGRATAGLRLGEMDFVAIALEHAHAGGVDA